MRTTITLDDEFLARVWDRDKRLHEAASQRGVATPSWPN